MTSTCICGHPSGAGAIRLTAHVGSSASLPWGLLGLESSKGDRQMADPFDLSAEAREFIESATVLAEPYREEITRLHTELRRTEGDLAVAVREATKARAVLAAVEAALAGDEQAVWKVAY